jgi:hypothetical protein
MRAIAARYEMVPDEPALVRLRDVYLEAWAGEHTRRELIELAAVAIAVYPLSRARSWERALSALPPEGRGEYRDAVPGWLHELLTEQPPTQPSP